MKRLLNAVDERLSTVGGPWFFGLAVDNAQVPYGVWRQVGPSSIQYESKCGGFRHYYETVSIQFSYFDTNYERVCDKIDAVMLTFEASDLDLAHSDAFVPGSTRKISQSTGLDPDLMQEGNEVWEGILIIELMAYRRA